MVDLHHGNGLGLTTVSVRPWWGASQEALSSQLMPLKTGGVAGGHLKEDKHAGEEQMSLQICPFPGGLSTGRMGDPGALQKLPQTPLILTICG